MIDAGLAGIGFPMGRDRWARLACWNTQETPRLPSHHKWL